jgi:hypothetical protein
MRGEKDARIELITRATALLGTAMKPQQQPQPAATSADGKCFELVVTIRLLLTARTNDGVRKC